MVNKSDVSQFPRTLDGIREMGFVVLTSKQKKIIWAGIVFLGLLTLIVPWKHEYGGGVEVAVGYSFIFSPPKTRQGSTKLDLPRIILPMFVVVCATMAALVMTGEKSQE